MKVFRLLVFVLAVGLGVTSCSTDDDVDSIAGNKYETTYVKMVITPTEGSVVTVEYKTKAELEEAEIYMIVEFNSDGKVYTDGEEDGTWTQSGSTITITSIDEDGETDTFTATVDGNVLKITDTETDEDGTYSIEMQFTKM